MVTNMCYSQDVVEESKKSMELIKSGRVRNHKLKNKAAIHSGENEEKEYYAFRDFLPSKNFDFVYNLRGSDNHV